MLPTLQTVGFPTGIWAGDQRPAVKCVLKKKERQYVEEMFRSTTDRLKSLSACSRLSFLSVDLWFNCTKVHLLLPSSSSSSSTRAACRLAWEPSPKNTFLITPALGARIVCCGEKTHRRFTHTHTHVKRSCVARLCVSRSPPSSLLSWPSAGLQQPLYPRPSPAPGHKQEAAQRVCEGHKSNFRSPRRPAAPGG